MKVNLAEANTHLIKAKQIHQKAIVFDGHCDTILKVMNHKRTLEKKSTTGHLDIPRMKEGGEALEGDLGVLRVLHRLGVRFLTLTWNQRNQIADGIGEPQTGSGLTEFGLKVLADKGGVIGITFVPNFLTQEKRKTTVKDVVKHIDYLVEKVGVDCIGLGSDFDGTGDLPLGLEGVDKIPNLTEELLDRGYKEREIEKILGGNFLRVFKEVVG